MPTPAWACLSRFPACPRKRGHGTQPEISGLTEALSAKTQVTCGSSGKGSRESRSAVERALLSGGRIDVDIVPAAVAGELAAVRRKLPDQFLAFHTSTLIYLV